MITAINVDTNEVTLSNSATADGSNISLAYGGFNTMRLTGDNTIGFIRVLGSTIELRGNNTVTEDIYINSGVLKVGYNGNGTTLFNGALTINTGEVTFGSDNALLSTNPAGYAPRRGRSLQFERI